MEGYPGMKSVGLILAMTALAACGANGEPLRPTSSTNLTVGTNGASIGTNFGVTNGAVSLNVGQSISSN